MTGPTTTRDRLADAISWLRRSIQNETAIVAAGLLIVLSLWTFIEIVDEIEEGEQEEIDVWVAEFLWSGDSQRPIGPDWLIAAAIDATSLGSAFVLVLIILLVAGFLAIKRQYLSVWLVLIASALGQVLSSSLKSIFARERPDETLHLVEVSSASFPSGHAMLSAVVYLTLGVILATTLRRKRERAYVLLASVLLTGIVGLSRVYIGVHYVTDVLGGWAVGLCWAMLCLLATNWLQRRDPADHTE